MKLRIQTFVAIFFMWRILSDSGWVRSQWLEMLLPLVFTYNIIHKPVRFFMQYQKDYDKYTENDQIYYQVGRYTTVRINVKKYGGVWSMCSFPANSFVFRFSRHGTTSSRLSMNRTQTFVNIQITQIHDKLVWLQLWLQKYNN